jgi:ATP-dependent DNA helicase PIF1
MRFGNLDAQTINAFKGLARKVTYTDGIDPTELYTVFRSGILLA